MIDRLESEVASHLKTISDCQQRIREDEMVRRRLHNTIQELKGMQCTLEYEYRQIQHISSCEKNVKNVISE